MSADYIEGRTVAELEAMMQVIHDQIQLLRAQEQQLGEQVAIDTAANLSKLREALDGPIATLLGDNTTDGSIRSWIAPITNNQTLTGSEGKALARLLITAVQVLRLDLRQTMRISAAQVGEFDTLPTEDDPVDPAAS